LPSPYHRYCRSKLTARLPVPSLPQYALTTLTVASSSQLPSPRVKPTRGRHSPSPFHQSPVVHSHVTTHKVQTCSSLSCAGRRSKPPLQVCGRVAVITSVSVDNRTY